METLTELLGSRVRRATDRGDAFPGPIDFSALSLSNARGVCGQSELVERLFDLPAGQWSGPLRSAYGWHLIYITQMTPAKYLAFADTKERVLADYREEQRRRMNGSAWERLRAQYVVRHQTALK
jgi:hypothetical protein